MSQPDEPRRHRPPSLADDPRPLVLMVADDPGWAFDIINHDVERHVPEVAFRHAYVREPGGWPDLAAYDAVFLPYHRWSLDVGIPWRRALGAVSSQWFFPEDQAPVGDREAAVARRYARFQVTVRRLHKALSPLAANAVYLPNPVDVGRFRGRPSARPLVASWNGNARHDSGAGAGIKGFDSVVVPACKAARVPLVVAEYHTSRVPHAEMPAFYRRSTVALCASAYEGASNSMLEAMASGLAVVTTDVGNVADIVASQRRVYGETGMEVVPRRPDAFAAVLRRLAADPVRVARMGAINRREAVARWSWDAWRDRYAAFFGTPL